ncbi:MAG: SDR family oxidoreductase [Chloroflexota bacterium]|nr:SDR family oxidoreductase [Chloroflexota bacterium]
MTERRRDGLGGAVALVTGAGSGIGQASAVALAEAGARIVITELPDRLDNAEITAGMIVNNGGEAVVTPLDVTSLESINDCVGATTEAFDGRIDVLVNNAGINVPQMAFDVTENAWDRVLDVNLKGVFFMAQAVGKMMRDQSPAGGSIVNMASQMGLVGYSNRSAYCSSKAGVINLSRVLAFEWAEVGIRVNAVCPTFVETPLTRPMFEDAAFKADVYRRIPLGRLATPEDVAAAVVFLAGRGAGMITGHALTVDGGWTAV